MTDVWHQPRRSIEGGDGNDQIVGGTATTDRWWRGNDVLLGWTVTQHRRRRRQRLAVDGHGSDTGFGGDGTDVLVGDLPGSDESGTDLLVGASVMTFCWRCGERHVVWRLQEASLHPMPGRPDWLIGGAGDDLMYGGGGNDVIWEQLDTNESGNDTRLRW